MFPTEKNVIINWSCNVIVCFFLFILRDVIFTFDSQFFVYVKWPLMSLSRENNDYLFAALFDWVYPHFTIRSNI